MTDKLLALNVPIDFLSHVDFARKAITRDHKFPTYRRDPDTWVDNRYNPCIQVLGAGSQSVIAHRLLDIETRFLALLNTIDQSVPVAPLYRRYSSLAKTVSRRANVVLNEDYVVKSLGHDNREDVPHTLEDFRQATSLAEKALIAELLAHDFEDAMREVATHFDYKRGKFGRGAGRTYSLIYAVLALAPIFEQHNADGRAAAVTLATNGSGHEGVFLDFVSAFVRIVDAGTLGLRATDGFNERVRKIAQKRGVDADLVGLLDHANVDEHVMLEFMSRADALKT